MGWSKSLICYIAFCMSEEWSDLVLNFCAEYLRLEVRTDPHKNAHIILNNHKELS